jgi:hypothetical protein
VSQSQRQVARSRLISVQQDRSQRVSTFRIAIED